MRRISQMSSRGRRLNIGRGTNTIRERELYSSDRPDFSVTLISWSIGATTFSFSCAVPVIIMSLPTLDRLPLELVDEIFRTCAQDLVISDRAAAVRIALVSRAVSSMVRPTLYHTLVITQRNARGDPEVLKGVLPHVRYLYSTLPLFRPWYRDCVAWVAYIVEHWRPAGKFYIDAPWKFILAYIEAAPAVRLDGIRVIFEAVADAFVFQPRDNDKTDPGKTFAKFQPASGCADCSSLHHTCRWIYARIRRAIR